MFTPYGEILSAVVMRN
jgi:RNA recognition motif-containing protein